jgi:hypothetical protein
MSSRAAQLASVVMAGLVPAIHVFVASIKKDVDPCYKAGGHDEEKLPQSWQSAARA